MPGGLFGCRLISEYRAVCSFPVHTAVAEHVVESMLHGRNLDQLLDKVHKVLLLMFFPHRDDLIIVYFQKIAEFSSGHRLVKGNLPLEALDDLLTRIPMEEANVNRGGKLNALRNGGHEFVETFPLARSFLGIEIIAILELNNVAMLKFSFSFEYHEVRFHACIVKTLASLESFLRSDENALW